MFSKIAALTFVHNINKGWDIACFIERTFFGSKMHSTNGAETNVKKKNKKKTQNGLQIYRRGSQFNSRGLTTTK